MKIVRVRRTGSRRSKPKVLIDSQKVGASWSNDTALKGGELFSITSLSGTDYDYRVELSREEVMRLYKYALPHLPLENDRQQ